MTTTTDVSSVARASVCDRVMRREVVEPQPQHAPHRAGRPARSRRVNAVGQPEQHGVELLRRPRRAPRARCEPIEPRRRPTATGRGSWLCANACSCRPVPGRAWRSAPPRAAGRCRRRCGCRGACSLAAVTAPTPHSRSTGSGCRKASSPTGGTTSSPSGLATRAGDLGQELGAGDADGDRQAHPLAHRAAQPDGDLRRRARRCATARRRRGTPRRSRCPRRTAWCRRTPRTPPCWRRCRPTGAVRRRRRAGHSRRACAPAHRRAHAVRLGLVAGAQHHAHRRRSPGGRAARRGRAAPPRRRTHRGRRAGSTRRLRPRTYVRNRGAPPVNPHARERARTCRNGRR